MGQPSKERIEHLTDSRRLHRQAGANELQTRRARAEDSAGAKRPQHLVVSRVNDPQIAIMASALSRNWQHGMRINGCHRHANDFEVRPGITLAE